jgi:hypothetical protein
MLVYIPYDSITRLVIGFQDICLNGLSDIPSGKEANFVLIDPDDYYGSYGGLIYDQALKHLKVSKDDYCASSIGYGMSIVWWMSDDPDFYGDVNVLSWQKYVAVTPDLFERLKPNPINSSNSGRSSYFAVALDA